MIEFVLLYRVVRNSSRTFLPITATRQSHYVIGRTQRECAGYVDQPRILRPESRTEWRWHEMITLILPNIIVGIFPSHWLANLDPNCLSS